MMTCRELLLNVVRRCDMIVGGGTWGHSSIAVSAPGLAYARFPSFLANSGRIQSGVCAITAATGGSLNTAADDCPRFALGSPSLRRASGTLIVVAQPVSPASSPAMRHSPVRRSVGAFNQFRSGASSLMTRQGQPACRADGWA